MEDIVAVCLRDTRGKKHYFLTWGRILGRIDETELKECVSRFGLKCGIRQVGRVRVCASLREASKQAYFFEKLFLMSNKKIPFGKRYGVWKKTMGRSIRAGEEIYYCGAG